MDRFIELEIFYDDNFGGFTVEDYPNKRLKKITIDRTKLLHDPYNPIVENEELKIKVEELEDKNKWLEEDIEELNKNYNSLEQNFERIEREKDSLEIELNEIRNTQE